MNKKILIVDDEQEQIDFASALVEENGYEAITAKDGVQGIEKARKEHPSLILLDIMMPQKGGIGMYQDLKKDERTRNIPVVIVTGVTRGGAFDEELLTQGGLITPPDGYVEKPMKPDDIERLLKSLVP